MTVFDHPDFDDHEHVEMVCDPAVGLRAIIAIHRQGTGVAAGGIRMQPYATEEEALGDVLRLSRAMTYKIVMAGLEAGGAKSVVLGDPATEKTPELLESFAACVNRLEGRYHCGGDVGISSRDMEIVRKITSYTPSVDAGDLAIPTAHGVFAALRAAVSVRLERHDLRGVRVAVQGVGEVGGHLSALLARAGAQVSVADVDASRCRDVAATTGATPVSPEEILETDAQVFCPCALGGVVNDSFARRTRAVVICGAANNQLASPECAEVLDERNVLYAPDFIANAGGVIAGLGHSLGDDTQLIERRLAGIGETVRTVFAEAAASGETPVSAAERIARRRIERDLSPESVGRSG